MKTITIDQFKADCLRLIDEMNRDHEPATITKHGQPVATLAPIAADESRPIICTLNGSMLRYDEPFAPAASPGDWKGRDLL